MFWLILYTEEIQCEGQVVRCRFWLFQYKMYAKYVNNQQRERRVVNDDIKNSSGKLFNELHLPMC